jgi:hypothetical protein
MAAKRRSDNHFVADAALLAFDHILLGIENWQPKPNQLNLPSPRREAFPLSYDAVVITTSLLSAGPRHGPTLRVLIAVTIKV